MPWYRLQDNQCRNWEVNSDEIARIVRSNIYQRELINPNRSRFVSHPPPWYEPWLPTTISYETNFSGLVDHVDAEAPRWVRESWVQANLNGEGFFQTLVHLRQEALAAGDTFRNNSLRASSQSQQNINRSADLNQGIVNGLTHVRNTSAGVLLAGATVLSGGAALAAAGAGAGIRFTARVQDGGTVGQAAQETAIDLFVTFVTRGAGRALPTSSVINQTQNIRNAAALALFGIATNTTADVAKTMVTGEVGRTPLQGVQGRLGVETTNAIISSILSRVGLPVSLTSPSREAADAVVNAALGFIGDRIVDAARGVNSSNSSDGNVPPNTLLVTSPGLAAAEAWVRTNAMRRV